ncbi:MAG TPA: carbohydrate kinase [Leeuwenhoekiella sp.]|uniref:Carbohydrate kinase n=1 Tax=Zunongwangia profunda TaxID=398743 RepID=A0A3D5J1U7_9FLAO|nr:carbohydrate kinase [Leeuwenhoekiella palythoae]MBH12361.1 carbohydrate kinase [Leeuwenhoekiella sp.]HCV81933.1 carbohydrate kinase [Zunongwangia profunda]UBZ09171.1 carbohydrate kinase [Leeuwenhoekiella palythoae]HBO28573.1 carbohydrate kinase [Leeuwenhoekiella sp.]HCQ77687.1 carbohydrate kinase [Leeuwenhoekiella sp.]|tara:strand:- start:2700 stop:3593 length:894 start_codon:yes stop_codon:yes gene_type:complete
MKESLNAICFGEILWDVFPDGKALGGAPLNLCLRMKSLGVTMQMISRLGQDALAEETREAIQKFRLDQNLIQEDPALETGKVEVTLDASGSASYNIKKPVAWDAIALTDKNKNAVQQADLFIFGSLAARSNESSETLNSLLQLADYAIFDVNLRAPHYEMETLIEFMKQAQMIKMNDEELEEVIAHLNITGETIHEQLAEISKRTATEIICVTLGAKGAVLYQNGTTVSNSGYSTKVIDTVGAGDSFLAGLIYQLFKVENTPEKALAFACALGALVAGTKGANAPITSEQIEAKMRE